MATAKQIAWRKKFAARYGGGKTKAKARSRKASKKVTTTARRRRAPSTFRSRVRRSYRRARASRKGAIPLMDTLHGIYTLDGMTDNRVNQAGQNFIGAVAGTSNMSFENGIAHLQKGAEYALKNPQKAMVGGMKNFATIYVARKILGVVGIPKTVKIFGKKIQVR